MRIQNHWASLVAQSGKNMPAVQDTRVRSVGWEDPLEKQTATHSSIFAWKISWTEEPGGLQSMGLQTVGCNWVTNTYLPTESYAKYGCFISGIYPYENLHHSKKEQWKVCGQFKAFKNFTMMFSNTVLFIALLLRWLFQNLGYWDSNDKSNRSLLTGLDVLLFLLGTSLLSHVQF